MDSLPAAAEAGSLAATQEFGERLRDRVKAMIPDKGGWYDIYKKSIVLNEVKSGQWELTTIIREIAPASIPAETTAIWIGAKASADPVATNVGRILASHNPWTVDTIPALDRPVAADLIIKPASPGEVEHFRKARLAERRDIEHEIARAGGKTLAFDAIQEPKITGRVLADVPFLALRLEYGYGGFPKTPIWSRIDMEGEIVSKSQAVQRAGYGTFASRWREKG